MLFDRQVINDKIVQTNKNFFRGNANFSTAMIKKLTTTKGILNATNTYLPFIFIDFATD